MTHFDEGSETAGELAPRKTPQEFYEETLELAKQGYSHAAQVLPAAARAALDDARKPFDPVQRPAHYASGAVECIDAIRAALGDEAFVAYCRGNAIKYAWRTGKKANHAEDLRKGAWYLERAASVLEEARDAE